MNSPSLAQRLKAATAAMHRQVESGTFMARLLRGEIDRARYLDLLVNLHALYGALEQVLSRSDTARRLAPVVMPELFRGPALDADLAALGGNPTAPNPTLARETLRYVEHLHALGATRPPLLVAHAYVRYLGDLHGGQALGRVVARALHLEPGDGTAFYDFGDHAECRRLVQRFRAGLDAVNLSAEESDAVVDEAVSAFARHERLFEELADR